MTAMKSTEASHLSHGTRFSLIRAIRDVAAIALFFAFIFGAINWFASSLGINSWFASSLFDHPRLVGALVGLSVGIALELALRARA